MVNVAQFILLSLVILVLMITLESSQWLGENTALNTGNNNSRKALCRGLVSGFIKICPIQRKYQVLHGIT